MSSNSSGRRPNAPVDTAYGPSVRKRALRLEEAAHCERSHLSDPLEVLARVTQDRATRSCHKTRLWAIVTWAIRRSGSGNGISAYCSRLPSRVAGCQIVASIGTSRGPAKRSSRAPNTASSLAPNKEFGYHDRARPDLPGSKHLAHAHGLTALPALPILAMSS